MRAGIAACNGRPALAVTSPAGKHFMPGNAELERIEHTNRLYYPQDILAASVQAIRATLGGLKGGAKPAMASPAELATAIRSDEYLGPGRALARSALILPIATGGKQGDSRYRMATHACYGLRGSRRAGCVFAIPVRRFRRVLWSAVTPKLELARTVPGRRVQSKTIVAIAGTDWFEPSSLQHRVHREPDFSRSRRAKSEQLIPEMSAGREHGCCSATDLDRKKAG